MRKTIYFTIKRWHARLFFSDKCVRIIVGSKWLGLGNTFWMRDETNLYENKIMYTYIGKGWAIRNETSYYNENNNE